MIIVSVTAMPYAAAMAPDDPNPITISTVATISAQFTCGTKICPISRADVCSTSSRGTRPS